MFLKLILIIIINFFFIVLSFLAMRTAHTRELISTHDSSKDVVWRKENPYKTSVFRNFDFLGVIFPENPTKLAGHREVPAKMKRSNNS